MDNSATELKNPVLPDSLKGAARLSSSYRVPTILAVDDDKSTLGFLKHVLSKEGYNVMCAETGEEAMRALQSSGEEISAMIVDLHMPGISGLEVVARMKNHPDLSLIPAVMATASEEPEVVREGIEAGVYYCLRKPLDTRLLVSVMEAAIREFDLTRMRHEAMNGQRNAMALMETSRYFCRTVKEAEYLAQFLACAYPDPKRAVIGITELLINAIEHGNLGVTYEEKQQLVTAGIWRESVEARQKLPEYATKHVDIILQRKPDGIYLQVSDEGKGFEWWKYLEIDPARATHPNGRGIALANKISFDRLHFTQNGSRVLAVVETVEPGVRKGEVLHW